MKSCVAVIACALGAALVPCLAAAEPAARSPAEDPFCGSFLSIQAEANRVRGDRVDLLTVFLGVDVRCDERLVEYGQSVLKPNTRLRKGWLERLEKSWSAAYCKPGSQSAEAIRNGWTIASIVRTSDGQEFRIKATCHEAMAEAPGSSML